MPVLPDNLDPGYPPALGYLLAPPGIFSELPCRSCISSCSPLPWVSSGKPVHCFNNISPGKNDSPGHDPDPGRSCFSGPDRGLFHRPGHVVLSCCLPSIRCCITGRWWLAVAVTGLLFSHMRGVMVAATLGIFDLYWKRGKNRSVPENGTCHICRPDLFGAWMIFHYHTKGWIGIPCSIPLGWML